jgi:pimeloyl-ACP methyl ester carboxylesterase
VIERTIKDGKINGILYSPDQVSGRLPGIILISGSDGGVPGANAIPKTFIEQLVNNGFIVLGLAYFGVDNLPQALERIDLEYFEMAQEWLFSRPDVSQDGTAIIGESRGGELALILGTMLKRISAIVAYVPSSMVTGGLPHPNQPAWRYRNHDITPYLGALSRSDLEVTELEDLRNSTRDNLISAHKNTEEDPFVIADLFAARNLTEKAKLAEIPVEKIECPVLLLSGGKDAIWTSTYYCQAIMRRLNLYNSSIQRKHVDYENAGHGLIASFDSSTYHPVGEFWCKLGGTTEGNCVANEQSLHETLAFLSSR